MPDFDVVVIGAGPAGLACALESARRGQRPLLLEKEPLVGGIYCISATRLQSVYNDYPGRWSPAHEDLWQRTLTWFQNTAEAWPDTEARAGLIRQHGEAAIRTCLRQYEQLRFGRLCSYLRQREPTALAGFSILIYELDDAEVREALTGPPVKEAAFPARPIVNGPAGPAQ